MQYRHKRGRSRSQLGAGVEGELAQDVLAPCRELHQNFAPVFRVARAADQTLSRQPVYQFDGTVMAKLKALGEIGNAGLLAGRLAFDRQHELVVLRLDPDFTGRSLAESLKEPDLVTELRQGLIVGEGEAMVIHKQR